jgi:TetR/AcrR family transcriptional repressor of nem operon
VIDVDHHQSCQAWGRPVRVSREQANANRERVIETAARLFRERGFDGIGLADLMKEAGLTHGGFYRQFPSKDALLAEATSCASSQTAGYLAAVPATERVATYLSSEHRANPGSGCAIAALAGDVARADTKTQAAFAAGVESLLACVGGEEAGTSEPARAEAIQTLSTLVGALVIARATAMGAPDLSDEVLATVRDRLAGDPR